ncbi:hypothetical protein BDL97_08G137400 [Sphagnum fallax]|nr:hypothetical protein BDL97_08G137400 [Sphagnum fallax]
MNSIILCSARCNCAQFPSLFLSFHCTMRVVEKRPGSVLTSPLSSGPSFSSTFVGMCQCSSFVLRSPSVLPPFRQYLDRFDHKLGCCSKGQGWEDAAASRLTRSKLGSKSKTNAGRKKDIANGSRDGEGRQSSDIDDERFMREALHEAQKGARAGEVPVGAVLVYQGSVIARSHNRVEAQGDPTAHAEMLCIRSAAAKLGGWRLLDATLYVTLEPCPMCAGAILQARIGQLVWGARNSLLGADGSWISLFPASSQCEGECDRELGGDTTEEVTRHPIHPFHPDIEVRRNVLADESSFIMRSFFQRRRLRAKEVDSIKAGQNISRMSLWSRFARWSENPFIAKQLKSLGWFIKW